MAAPLVAMLLGGGLLAALALKGKGGSDTPAEQPQTSAMVNGQAYHVMVRTPFDIRNPADLARLGFDLGVVASGMKFQDIREIDDSSGGPGGDPTVIKFVADWGGETGEFIHDLPSARVIAVTPLEGNG